MAKLSAILKNERRKKIVKKYKERRSLLLKIANSPEASWEEKMAARKKLSLLPKNANPIRIRNRCQKTGRPRGYFRFFGLSRIALREMALRGELPGVRKGSL